MALKWRLFGDDLLDRHMSGCGIMIQKVQQNLAGRLKKRTQFLSAAKGIHIRTRGFTLQGRLVDEKLSPALFGFTITKKIGSAVERNLIRRRLREALRLCVLEELRTGFYVFIARKGILELPFWQLQNDMKVSLVKMNQINPGRAHKSKVAEFL